MLGDRERCLAAGMDDHLANPYTQARLRSSLPRWLRGLQVTGPVTDGSAAPAPARDTQSRELAAINLSMLQTLRELDPSGGNGLALEVFGMFLQVAPVGLDQARAAIEADDAAALGRVAHTLKSSAANVGADTLAACYRDLEQSVRDGRMDEAARCFDRTSIAHAHAMARLQELQGELQ